VIKQAKSRPQAPKSQGVSPSNWSIEQLPGLSPEDLTLLLDRGIQTTFDLIKLGRTPEKRTLLASDLQIHLHHVTKWVALADLARIPSVGCEYCGLLLHAGIASPMQLAQTPIARLHRQILKLHVATMQRRDLCPTIDIVDRWIQQARILH
jgi:hypothetical protein